MKVYIIRHAQSTNNALPDQRDRVSDPALSELGQQQALLLAEHLATGIDPEYEIGASVEATSAKSTHRYNITRLFTSAMYRSLLTAQVIGQVLELAPEVWVDIHEQGGIFLNHGNEQGVVGYPGKGRSEILAEFPNYVLPEFVTEEGWWDPNKGREDWPSCQGRAIKVANILRKWAIYSKETAKENVAIISHGGFIDALLKALTNQLPKEHLFFHHYNTGITRIDFSPDGHVDVRHLNRFDHLPSELIT